MKHETLKKIACPGSWYNNNLKKSIDFMSLTQKDAFFTRHVPNDHHCTCLSNK